jgi:protease-4
VLELEGSYVEAPQAPLISRLLGEDRRPFVGLLSRIATAARDDRLSTVVLVIRPLGIGWGKAGELREAIARLRDAGRRTVVLLDMAAFSAAREYYVAAAADEVYIVPGGVVPIVGLAAEYFFLGGLWEKLGIEFEVGKAGRYKSAVEAYAGKGMSDATREMANSLLDSINDAFIDAIVSDRRLTRDEVLATIDRAPMLPAELEQLGLVDGSFHLDVLLDEIGGDVVRQKRYASVLPAEVGFEPVAEVALIYGTGTVVEGRGTTSRSGAPVFASKTVSKAILDAAKDDSIDAIILRIDSPGGSALASEQIWRTLQEARRYEKPIVASFSDLAASGGYYVASGADSIVSAAGTLTGSIGVFALRPVLGGAFEKLGVAVESLTRGRHADFLLATDPLSEGARKRLQDIVLETYRIFLERVAAGRSLSLEAVDAVAQGRVWTGEQALEHGLVDELGGLHTAVSRVRTRLGLDAGADVSLVAFPPPQSLSEEIADILDSRIAAFMQSRIPLPDALHRLEVMLLELPLEGPLMIPPVLVEIH